MCRDLGSWQLRRTARQLIDYSIGTPAPPAKEPNFDCSLG
jgi:hypothetical protein